MPTVKKLWAIFLTVIFLQTFQATAQAFDHGPALRGLRQTLESGDQIELAERTDRAIDGMIKLAAFKLRRAGERQLAESILNDWERHYQGKLVGFVAGVEDLGDHAAWSFWLEAVYIALEAKLGMAIMEFTHLDDIHIVNLAVPVTFHLDSIGDDVIDVTEYGKHFEPLAGVLAYWGTFVTCEVVTWATGWFLVCAPAGIAAEIITVNYIAPPFTPRLFERFYPEGSGDLTMQSCHCDETGCDCGCGDDCDCGDDCSCDHCDDGELTQALPPAEDNPYAVEVLYPGRVEM